MDADREEVRQFLQTYPKKTLDLDVLQDAFASWDYSRFRPAVAALLADGSLIAVRSAGVDFSGLPRRLKRVPAKLFSSVTTIQTEAIQLALSEKLDFSFYYEQPLTAWQADLPYIRKLSAWLSQGLPQGPASLQQRSWDIFADEKYLLEKGAGLLKRLGLTTADLGICDQPDPLMMAIFFSLNRCSMARRTQVSAISRLSWQTRPEAAFLMMPGSMNSWPGTSSLSSARRQANAMKKPSSIGTRERKYGPAILI